MTLRRDMLQKQLLLLHSIASSRTGFLGLCLVSAMALMAVFAPWIAPYEPTQIDMLNRLQPPSWSHWMGTDLTGRDVFSRLIWGARPSLQVGILAVLIGLPGGFAVGLLAGFYRGTILEAILMRIVEIIAAVPLLLLLPPSPLPGDSPKEGFTYGAVLDELVEFLLPTAGPK